jgi:UDPglucose 6-dehydrogenase
VDRSKTSSDYAKKVKDFEKEVDITFVTTPEAVVESVVEALYLAQVKG